MKKCPPGTICLETTTTLLIIFFLLILSFFLMRSFNQTILLNNQPAEKNVIDKKNTNGYSSGFPFFPSYPYTNLPGGNASRRFPTDRLKNRRWRQARYRD